MISTLDGSRPSPEDFLKSKVAQLQAQEEIVEQLQRGRMPTLYQEVASGQEPQDVRRKALSGILKI
jgi:hypothetical protein